MSIQEYDELGIPWIGGRRRAFTVSEYAHLLGYDPSVIRRRILKGELEAVKVGKTWLIPVKDWEDLF